MLLFKPYISASKRRFPHSVKQVLPLLRFLLLKFIPARSVYRLLAEVYSSPFCLSIAFRSLSCFRMLLFKPYISAGPVDRLLSVI
jgi:hypothetical protein